MKRIEMTFKKEVICGVKIFRLASMSNIVTEDLSLEYYQKPVIISCCSIAYLNGSARYNDKCHQKRYSAPALLVRTLAADFEEMFNATFLLSRQLGVYGFLAQSISRDIRYMQIFLEVERTFIPEKYFNTFMQYMKKAGQNLADSNKELKNALNTWQGEILVTI
jgi:hypothetical protein